MSPSRYTAILATEEHHPITTVKECGRYDNLMGLFLDGVPIGHGSLDVVKNGKKEKILHTSATEIFRKYRRKGHGIYLYINLIEKAREIGATEIRSDISLNRYSRRMWRDKLPKVYPVKVHKMKKPCRRCGHIGTEYYSIDLRDGI